MRLGVAGALVDGVHRAGDVEVDPDSGRVTEICLPGPGRGIAVPGFVDLHVNGFAQVTLAPELPGALALVDLCLSAGVIVSCGHSNATATEAHAAFDRGATMVTHLFDAMRPFTHRDPGIAGAALTRDDVALGLIADPSHLSPEAVWLAFRAGPDRVVLVTDALAAGGCRNGHFSLGAVEFDVVDGDDDLDIRAVYRNGVPLV